MKGSNCWGKKETNKTYNCPTLMPKRSRLLCRDGEHRWSQRCSMLRRWDWAYRRLKQLVCTGQRMKGEIVEERKREPQRTVLDSSLIFNRMLIEQSCKETTWSPGKLSNILENSAWFSYGARNSAFFSSKIGKRKKIS